MAMRTNDFGEPWVDVPTARCFLRWLSADDPVDGLACFTQPVAVEALADWLIEHGLGARAYGRGAGTSSNLRRCLQGDMFAAAAESSLKQRSLQAILGAFAEAAVPLVLLKGAALSLTVYDDPAQRTMSDIDIWVQDADMAQAAHLMAALGYVANVKGERPFALQQMARGEIEFVQPKISASLVDFHWSPFPGWWLMRTATVDDAGVWARRESLTKHPYVSHLSPEDTVIQLAVHMAINHQFGLSALRSLVDMALTAEKRGVDWGVVAERAKDWRVGTAVYTVLSLLDQLIGLDGLEEALTRLKPSARRRRLIHRFVTPESVLAGRDITSGWQRFLLLLLLVDRRRDAAKLVFRALWPEPEWLEARYGNKVGHVGHVVRMVRYGEI